MPRRNRTLAKLAALFAVLVMSGAAQVRADDSLDAPPPAQFTLDNGLQIVVIPDRRAPVVTHMIWYKVGSADETRGKSGIAHFLEHLMFKGTRTVPSGQFSHEVAAIGGEDNAFTTSDYTAYYQKVSPQALPMVMRYEADRMQNLVLDDEAVLPEREVVLQERRQRVDSRPGGILDEAMGAALFANHPYGIPVIGWQEEIEGLTAQDALTFYESHYGPNNAILVVAGDVEPDSVFELARETYGKVPQRGISGERQRPAEPAPLAARTVIYSDNRVTAPSLRRSYLVPSYRIAAPREAEALELLAAVLGGTSNSRIKRDLLVEDPAAASAGAYYSGGSYDMSEFSIYAMALPGHEVAEVEARIDAEIARLQEVGVTESELESAKRTLIKSTLFDRDSQTSMARLYGAVLASGGTVQDVIEWPSRIEAVTPEDVNRAARVYLNKNRSVTGYLFKEES
jgi:zinc protease